MLALLKTYMFHRVRTFLHKRLAHFDYKPFLNKNVLSKKLSVVDYALALFR